MYKTEKKSSKRVVALDVGGTVLKSAVVASAGRVLDKPALMSIDSSRDAESILATFARVVGGHVSQVEPSELLGVVLGFPGPFDYSAGVCLIQGVKKYEAIYGVNLRDDLRSRLNLEDLPILFRNDAEAAAVGEACYGAGRAYRRLVAVTLGTGCGSAFMVDGAPVNSGPGVPPNGWLYPMPFRGLRADDCFSRRGLEARMQSAGAATPDVREAAAAARSGDKTVLQVFQEFGGDLAAFLDPFAVSFEAQAVLVLGRIAGAFDLFGPALCRGLSVPAIPGERGADAALLGAAELLFNE